MAVIEIHSSSKWAVAELRARESKLSITDIGSEIREKTLILEAAGGTSDVGIWVGEKGITRVGNGDGRRRGRWVCGGEGKRVVSFSVERHDLGDWEGKGKWVRPVNAREWGLGVAFTWRKCGKSRCSGREEWLNTRLIYLPSSFC